MIVLDFFGQQLEWVWAIVFVHGPYGLDKVLVSAADAETSAATPWERV